MIPQQNDIITCRNWQQYKLCTKCTLRHGVAWKCLASTWKQGRHDSPNLDEMWGDRLALAQWCVDDNWLTREIAAQRCRRGYRIYVEVNVDIADRNAQYDVEF